ncbi:MAG: ABC transporter substrate-binding protein [Deltaproteobacteria bacterium]|nr:ABC transporter substrate-binding protein [Deltaproteobacteria bacterium]
MKAVKSKTPLILLGFLLVLIYFYFFAVKRGGDDENIPVFRKAVYLIPEKIDPIYFLSTAEHSISNLIFEGLFSVNDLLEIEPCLVQEWRLEGDGTKYWFKLKKDVLFHDGIPLTSMLVKQSLERLLSKDSPVQKTYNRIENIKIIDTSELEIKLKSPSPSFISLLAAPFAKITKPAQNLAYPIGTGPFVLKEVINSGNHQKILRLQRFEKYRQALPKIEELQLWELSEEQAINLAQAGFIHDTTNWISKSDLCSKEQACRKIEAPSAVTWLLSFNTSKHPLNNINLRKCLTRNFDQKYFIQNFVPDHVPAQAYLPRTLPGFLENLENHFDGDSTAECSDFRKVKLVLDYAVDLDKGKEMCQFMKGNFQKGNVEILCNGIKFDRLLQRIITGKADISFLAMTLDMPDPEYFVNVFESSSPFNMSNYHSKEIDRLLLDARSAPNKQLRATLYQQINKILYDNYVTLNISYPPHISYEHKCVAGLHIGIMGDSYINYTKVHLDRDCKNKNDFTKKDSQL